MIKTKSLTPAILDIVQERGTEFAFSGEYTDYEGKGTYLCRQCGLPLFVSDAKFHSACGWPSFDTNISGAVLTRRDPDGHRTEIICSRCQAHLGHVFEGEGFTGKNIRHCVNSLSLDFVPQCDIKDTQEAIFAAGCFWGVEYFFKQCPGVLKTEVGYCGGHTQNPSYEAVCGGGTGHYEAIRVIFDCTKTNFQALLNYFFEIHDFEQEDGQGPDRGEQYKSVVFYYDDTQKERGEGVIDELKAQGYSVATQLLPVTTFWPAQSYHQDYYAKTGKSPYCHRHTKIF